MGGPPCLNLLVGDYHAWQQEKNWNFTLNGTSVWLEVNDKILQKKSGFAKKGGENPSLLKQFTTFTPPTFGSSPKVYYIIAVDGKHPKMLVGNPSINQHFGHPKTWLAGFLEPSTVCPKNKHQKIWWRFILWLVNQPPLTYPPPRNSRPY